MAWRAGGKNREDGLGEGRKTPCLVPLAGWRQWESLSRARAHRMTQEGARTDGAQVLWDTDLSPCFLIFQAPRATGREPSLSEDLSRLWAPGRIHEANQTIPGFRCYRYVKPSTQSRATFTRTPCPVLCQGDPVHYSHLL